MGTIYNTLKRPYEFFSNRFLRNDVVPDVVVAARTDVFNSILSPFETYVVSLQSLLIWEQPYISAVAFVTVNCLYWLVVSWNRRFFSILSLTALVSFMYRTWVNQIWPEIKVPTPEDEETEEWTPVNPQVLSVPELSYYINYFCDKMLILWRDVWKLRKENHGLFCALMCAFLSILALVGRLVPGVLIIYVVVLVLSLGPGIALHLVPATLYDQLVGYFAESEEPPVSKSEHSSEDSDLEEFIPEASAEVIRQLSLRDESLDRPSLDDFAEGLALGEGSYMNETEDSSLFRDLGKFPSVEEESEAEEEVSEKSEPKEQEKKEMHFLLSHFKEDSSGSESDVMFTEGLSFNEDTNDKPVEAATPESSEQTVEESDTKISTTSNPEDELMGFEMLEKSDIPS